MSRNTPPRKTPKGYDGIRPTNHYLHDLLPSALRQVNFSYGERPDLILASWKELIGPQMREMAQATSFVDGILTVVVSNSSLYSLLRQYERGRLLKKMREQFPQTTIKNIYFRMG
ncbi:MAG: DUF721 domain-containing protein [Verrucomicrobia bacterium]|nr:DUF721 domain-containing protein [Verrucomicrobiota bacterium]